VQTENAEDYDLVCASVAKLTAEALSVTRLAVEALAEHRRQMAQLEVIRREAAELYEKVFPAPPRVLERTDERNTTNPVAKPASPFAPMATDRHGLPESRPCVEWGEDEMVHVPTVDAVDSSGDKLVVAMRRAAEAYPVNSDIEPAEWLGITSADDFIPREFRGP
jgi:hypothetical protein